MEQRKENREVSKMKKYGFGVDVGGTTCKIGFFENSGNMLDKWEIKTNTENHGASILDDIVASFYQAGDKLGHVHVGEANRKLPGMGRDIPWDRIGQALKDIHYEIHPFNAFVKPAWYADGVAILKEMTRLGIESEVYQEKSRILDWQRKKTTQKVNLYEKVQIPGYQEAIRKIKRYMEDEENLSKASSKIVKSRHEEEEAMEELQND